jgi:hypothetical protein
VSAEPVVQPVAEPAGQARRESPLFAVGRRLRYWSPVFALMLLFGEIAFLGLRPALAESRRLDVSEPAVEERLLRAQESRASIELQLRARRDPVYQERLRRLRLFPADGR